VKRTLVLWHSLYRWLPVQVDRRVRVIAWLSLIFQVILIGTGGAVRLTGSGLGCPTWPRCTQDSLVNVPEQGIHGFIEFGNRLLAVVIGIIAVLAVVAVVKLRREHKELFVLSLLLLAGIPAQAVIGGISVLTALNPYVVGVHFVVSISLVVLATIFVYRVYQPPGTGALVVPRWFATVAWMTAIVVAITILVGILTTGSGPHAGDAKAPRTGLNNEILEHVHSYPAYTVFALTIVLIIGVIRFRQPELSRYTVALLVIEIVQIAVGLIQARTGLPVALVNVHMVLASVLAAAMTTVLLSMRQHRH
jgi:cytochrome c oxidase assembly protein subunit 15